MKDLLCVAVFLSLLATACAPQPLTVTRSPVTLRLAVADSCQPWVEDLVASYEDSHPWVTVEHVSYNTLEVEHLLRAGGADLALLSWLQTPDPDDEKAALWAEPFARDGLAVIAHPDFPLADVGMAQLRDIFNGRVQELDGLVLTVVSREEGSGTRRVFEDLVLEGGIPTLNAVMMPSSEAMLDYVASTPGAVGYISMLWLDERVKVLSVEGVRADWESVAVGSYPISRQLYLASVDEPSGEAREFAQWLLAGAGGVLEKVLSRDLSFVQSPVVRMRDCRCPAGRSRDGACGRSTHLSIILDNSYSSLSISF